MSTPYSRMASTDEGARRLASARLRYRVLEVLHEALKTSGMSKAEVARQLGIRKSAVSQVFSGDGNVRMKTLAEYLHVMGQELDVAPVPAGIPRQRATGQCQPLRLAWDDATPIEGMRGMGKTRADVFRSIADLDVDLQVAEPEAAVDYAR